MGARVLINGTRYKTNFERWLAPENFTADGWQKSSLSALNSIVE